VGRRRGNELDYFCQGIGWHFQGDRKTGGHVGDSAHIAKAHDEFAEGIGVIPWSPLARGLLAGNRTREGDKLTARAKSDQFADYLYKPVVDFAVVDRLTEVAGAKGEAPARVALAWLLHKPGVTAPIVGATKLGHLEDALAGEQVSLSDEEINRLEEPYIPHAVVGHA